MSPYKVPQESSLHERMNTIQYNTLSPVQEFSELLQCLHASAVLALPGQGSLHCSQPRFLTVALFTKPLANKKGTHQTQAINQRLVSAVTCHHSLQTWPVLSEWLRVHLPAINTFRAGLQHVCDHYAAWIRMSGLSSVGLLIYQPTDPDQNSKILLEILHKARLVRDGD